jgi:hypothetical protein
MHLIFRLIKTLLLLAVETPKRRRERTASSYYAWGDTTRQRQAMHDWFADQRHPLPHDLPTNGGGMMLTRGRWVLDAGGEGTGRHEQRDDGQLSLGYGQGRLDAGFMLVKTRWLRVFPLAGIGGAGGGVEFQPTGDDAPPIETNVGTFTVNGGLGIDLTLRVWRVGLMIGMRLGYNYNVIHNGDALPTDGPFFRIVIGPRLFFSTDG